MMKKNLVNDRKILGLSHCCMVVILALAAGCASDALERDRGTSVRKMVAGQVYHPETLANPSAETLQGMDGERAVRDVNEVYREVLTSKEAKRQIKTKRLSKSMDDN